MRSRGTATAFCGVILAIGASGCLPPAAPGMVDQDIRPSPDDASLDEVARARPLEGERALLVVFPKTACSGSARMVVLGSDGTFFGAVAPGEAALLEIPTARRTLFVVSSVEIAAAPRTWFYVDETDVPPEPGGIVLSSTRGRSTKQCGSGNYVDVVVATKAELEATLAEATTIRWRTPRRAAGQAWLDEHRERVDELVGRPKLARAR